MKAFPTPSVVEDTGTQYQTTSASSGMDLRDYFAAKAMQSLLADQNYDSPMFTLTKLAYQFADAMMEARKQ